MLKRLASWFASLEPSTKTKYSEFALLSSVLALVYVAGCLVGQHGTDSHSDQLIASSQSVLPPITTEFSHADTNLRDVTKKVAESFTTKGTTQSDGKIRFRDTTASGFGTIDATYNPKDQTLSGSLISFIEIRVPEIILTRSTQTFIPLQTTETKVQDSSSPWTWLGVGGVFGIMLSVIGILVLHI